MLVTEVLIGDFIFLDRTHMQEERLEVLQISHNPSLFNTPQVSFEVKASNAEKFNTFGMNPTDKLTVEPRHQDSPKERTIITTKSGKTAKALVWANEALVIKTDDQGWSSGKFLRSNKFIIQPINGDSYIP